MPIWITESSEKFVIDMIADLNTSDGGSGVSSHPVSGISFGFSELNLTRSLVVLEGRNMEW